MSRYRIPIDPVWRFCLTVCLLGFVGCAPKSSYLVWRPAAVDINQIERLVVLDFEGDRNAAQSVRDIVVEQLRSNGHYTLVEPSELRRVAPVALAADGSSVSAAVEAARQLNIDAVLAANVLRYSTEGDNNAKVADVSISYQLIEAKTGEVRIAKQATRHFRHANAHSSPPEKTQALAELSRGCAREMVDQIAPHQSFQEVVLARQFYGRGVASLRYGNSLARSGDWAAAEEAWEAALKQNHQNHAAMYNLALAAQARHDYETANKRVNQAIAEFGDTLYHKYRRQLEQDQKQFLLTQKQMTDKQQLATSRLPNQSPIRQASFAEPTTASPPSIERLPAP